VQVNLSNVAKHHFEKKKAEGYAALNTQNFLKETLEFQ
jgi:hypothetical protein